jgi:hypothetical protein
MRSPHGRAQLRMERNMAKAIAYEQDNLRLPNGDYVPDAPELLHKFWLQFDLYVLVAKTQVGDVLVVTSMRCLEDVS